MHRTVALPVRVSTDPEGTPFVEMLLHTAKSSAGAAKLWELAEAVTALVRYHNLTLNAFLLSAYS